MKKEYFNCKKCRPPERPYFSAFETVREEESSKSFYGIFLCKCPACKGFSLLDYSEDWDLAPFVYMELGRENVSPLGKRGGFVDERV